VHLWAASVGGQGSLSQYHYSSSLPILDIESRGIGLGAKVIASLCSSLISAQRDQHHEGSSSAKSARPFRRIVGERRKSSIVSSYNQTDGYDGLDGETKGTDPAGIGMA
jgi:hypothetical protein